MNVEKKFCVKRDGVKEVVEDCADDRDAGVHDRKKRQHLKAIILAVEI